jgi:hypothetical protein
MKWVMMILFNLIMYPSFKAIMIYFTEEEMKMIELISWKKGYSDLKDKQVLRKIVIENIN